MTEISAEVRALCLERAGHRCEYCYCSVHGSLGYSAQHRAARRMGGSRLQWLGGPSNVLILCGSGTTGCHGWIEHHPADAYALGLALRTGWDPEQTPFRDIHDAWRLLLPDGTYYPIQMPPTRKDP